MLAIEYLLTRPKGVRSLVLSSSLCSTRFWVEEAHRLRSAMPAHIVAIEEPHRYREVLTAFLDDVDAGTTLVASGPAAQL
jgi:hypothetical protein